MMNPGTIFNFRNIILIEVPFADKVGTKLRPSLVLFEDMDNLVISGLTSNLNMKGILISKKDGLVFDSILKLNYIFTISKSKVKKTLMHLSEDKKAEVCKEIRDRIQYCLNGKGTY